MAEAEYRVEVFNGFWEALERLPAAQQDRVTELMDGHLVRDPKRMHPPMLKQLKGRFAHLYQFECGKSKRLLYEVDDAGRTVRIVYLGEHPEWEKRGKMGG